MVKSLEFKYRHPNKEKGLFDNGLRSWGYQLFTIDPPAVNTGHVGRPGQSFVDMSESIFKLTIERIATLIDDSSVSPACACVTRALEFTTQRMNVIDVIKVQIENIVKQPRRSAINKLETSEIYHLIWMTFYTTFHLAKFHFIQYYCHLSQGCDEGETSCSVVSQLVSDFITSSVYRISPSRFFISTMPPPQLTLWTLKLIAGN
jgi:hypothetical protein